MEDREKQTFVELKNKMVNQSMQLKSVSIRLSFHWQRTRGSWRPQPYRLSLTFMKRKGLPMCKHSS